MHPGRFDIGNVFSDPNFLQAKKLLVRWAGPDPDRWLWVDIAGQRLVLLEGFRAREVWRISTAQAGIDGRQDSLGTPPGVHRIAERIGDGEPVGRVFVSREPTGRIWSGKSGAADRSAEDLILTRILTLEGLQPGLNAGPGCDSRERYIYIHGTNHENGIGRPVSHGCVRMRNDDVLDLFDRVQPGDPVVIV